MAVHDYICNACRTKVLDFDVPIAIGGRAGAPDCPHCEFPAPMEVVAAIGRMSIFGEFAKFTTPIEDPSSPTGFRDTTISTLGDIRRLERESEQAERNGEGRKMIWRDYSQDQSNRDKHTMGEAQYETPAKQYLNGRPVEIRRGDPVTADHGTVED